MRDPRYYRGLKREVVRFLRDHSLLTTRQWREMMMSMERGQPSTHEEFAKRHRMTDPELKMTRQQLEQMITRPPTWRHRFPEGEAFTSALVLAAVGELGGPESSLGPTREAALQVLRRRLDPLDMAKVEITLAHYDASGPHPKHVFGQGWTEEEQRSVRLERIEIEREEGHQTEAEWLAERHTHLHLRLFDRFLYWQELASSALSLPRWYRELRYRTPGLTA